MATIQYFLLILSISAFCHVSVSGECSSSGLWGRYGNLVQSQESPIPAGERDVTLTIPDGRKFACSDEVGPYLVGQEVWVCDTVAPAVSYDELDISRVYVHRKGYLENKAYAHTNYYCSFSP